jgi:IS5 family transposase
LKSEGALGRNYLKGRRGDRANPKLCAAGHNLRLVLRWIRALLRLLITAIIAAFRPSPTLKQAS